MNLQVPNYGCYCPTCYQFVPDSRIQEIELIASRPDEPKGDFYEAWAEVFGVPAWQARQWQIRPSATVMAWQVMANQMRQVLKRKHLENRKRNWRGQFGKPVKSVPRVIRRGEVEG